MPQPSNRPGPVRDDLPKRHLFTAPVAVASIEALPVEDLGDGRVRVTFWLNVRDAAGRRCPDLAVDARIAGPDRTGEGMGHTDEFGQVRFRMAGPPGRYRCEVLDVGAGALDLERRPDGHVAVLETLA
jgi:hypothetical protein